MENTGEKRDAQSPPMLRRGKRSMLWLTQIRPTINAAAVGLGTPMNHRFIDFADECVEEGEAQSGAGAVDEGDGITDFAKLPELPFVNNQGGRNAEAHHIGKAV